MRKLLLIIDDHAMLREGIATWMKQNSDWQLLAQAGNKKDVDSIIKKNLSSTSLFEGTLGTDYIIAAIVDLSFKEGSEETKDYGFEIIKKLNHCPVPVRCVVFSSYDSGGYIEKSFSTEIKAYGFVNKSSDEKILLDALNNAALGKTYIQQELVPKLLELKDTLSLFTQKEKDLLKYITLDNSNMEIAKATGLSLRSVENYMTRMYDKAGVKKRSEFLQKIGTV